MTGAADLLLIVVLMLNFFALGTSRLRTIITVSALEGVVLSVLAWLAHQEHGLRSLLIVLVTILLKGVLIPRMLRRALRDVGMAREVRPLVGNVPSLLLGALGTGLTILFADALPLVERHAATLLIPTALSTVFTGFLLLTTRRQAIAEVAGYLILENGVFIMGLSLVDAMPFLVEMGVLLDLLVGIFVMTIILSHIKREFSSMDTHQLSQLKEG